jgi:hypothetical protein
MNILSDKKMEKKRQPVKNTRISIRSLIFMFVVAGMTGIFTSCDVFSSGDNDKVPVISSVRYLHPDSAAVEVLRPGDMFAIVGENLKSAIRAYINGIEAAINPALTTNTHMIVSVRGDMPFGDMDPADAEMNTIKLVSKAGETVFNFPILPPAPEIQRVSKEFANAGETVRLEGRFLYLVESVTFPGGIEAVSYEFASNGTWLDVVVPAGITDAGHITVTTSSGTSTESYRTMFNDRRGIFINYDDKNPYTPWGTPGVDAPYVGQDVPGIEPLDGNYLHWIYTDPLTPGMWWFQGLATPHAGWAGLAFPDYPENTPASELVFRMEINTPHDKFRSGYIQLSFDWWIEKDWNPFIVDGQRRPLDTDGWETVTIPLDSFERGGVTTYGPFKNSGEFLLRFVNPGEPAGAAFDEVNIAFDNLRIVQKF